MKLISLPLRSSCLHVCPSTVVRAAGKALKVGTFPKATWCVTHAGAAGLEELYRGAVSSSMETREELDGLLNLINRLNFNRYFAGEPDYHDLLQRPSRPARAPT